VLQEAHTATDHKEEAALDATKKVDAIISSGENDVISDDSLSFNSENIADYQDADLFESTHVHQNQSQTPSLVDAERANHTAADHLPPSSLAKSVSQQEDERISSPIPHVLVAPFQPSSTTSEAPVESHPIIAALSMPDEPQNEGTICVVVDDEDDDHDSESMVSVEPLASLCRREDIAVESDTSDLEQQLDAASPRSEELQRTEETMIIDDHHLLSGEDEIKVEDFGDSETPEDPTALEYPTVAVKGTIDLAMEQDALARQHIALVEEANRAARLSAEITPEVIADVQQLLRLFGIPFVVSPSEAEAQCAQLESLNLTDGTITDDNDIFLFGGQRVYRHFCSKKKAIEVYSAAEIHRRLCEYFMSFIASLLSALQFLSDSS
jgi:hypothetical protein